MLSELWTRGAATLLVLLSLVWKELMTGQIGFREMSNNHQSMTKPKDCIAHTLFDALLDAPERIPFDGGEIWVYSRRSPLKDTANEDSAGVVVLNESAAVFVVADGCGGMAGGERASRIAVDSLVSSVCSAVENAETLRSSILDGIEEGNQKVQAIGTGAATTLAAVELDHRTIRSYHIGDSTVLLVGNRGKIKLQTRSHAPVAYGVEAGLIHVDDAIHHEDLHLVSNVVGTNDTHIEIGPQRTMSTRDTLLLASDGVFDNLHIEEIVEIIRKGPLRKAAIRLADQTRQRMELSAADEPSKPDDVTFVLFRCVG